VPPCIWTFLSSLGENWFFCSLSAGTLEMGGCEFATSCRDGVGSLAMGATIAMAAPEFADLLW